MNRVIHWFNYAFTAAVDWLFRVKNPGSISIKAGVAIIIALVGGWALSFDVPTENGNARFSFGGSSLIPQYVMIIALIMAVVLIGFGIVYYFRERNELSRRKVLVIEGRGLRDFIGNPLSEAIPKKIKGRRETIPLEFREFGRDGMILDPEHAMQRAMNLPVILAQHETDVDRRDIAYVYGGLAPVPLTFLTGIILDDEHSIELFDWDRHIESWRGLTDPDDGERFEISGLERLADGAADIVLAVSVSYQTDMVGITTTLGNLPIISMTLRNGNPDCHWSAHKQQALCQQFLNTVVELNNRNVGRIHLFLAAQNSVVFRFGAHYDKRNLPPISVYQYQRGESPPFPWRIDMPVAGEAKPRFHNM